MTASLSNEGLALSALLSGDAIRVGVEAADWREAVRAAGDALAAGGATDPAYTTAMIDTVEELGPYIVIVPGIALAHARPSPAVHRVGISVVLLATPVAFGHRQNDPVRLVVGLAAPDDDSHVRALASLAGLLADDATRTALFAASDPDAVRQLVSTFEGATPT